MSDAVSSKELMRVDYCDFGGCAPSCWTRCTCTMDRWDGAPTLAWREGWRVWLAHVRAQRDSKRLAKRKPDQQEMFV